MKNLRNCVFAILLLLPFLSFSTPPLLSYSNTTTTYGTLTTILPNAAGNPNNTTFVLSSNSVNLDPHISLINNNRVRVLATAPAGIYTVTVQATDITGTTNASFTLTINKAPLVVTATSSTITYCAGFPACAATFTGFQNTDNASVLTGSLVCNYGVTAPAPAGTYTIDISTNSTYASPNYTISYINGTLTVSQSPTTTIVSPANTSIIVGNPMTFTATVTGNLTCIPTGTVIFNIDGVPQAPLTLNALGIATFTMPNFTAGVHNVFATYSGSTNHISSIAAIVTNTVCPIITFGNIANGTMNVAYNQTFTVTPADAYTFSIPIGALPRGLTLNTTTGQINGTPAEAGLFAFTIVAKNGIFCAKSKAIILKILGNNCTGRHFDPSAGSPISTGVVPVITAYTPAQALAGDYHLATSDFNNDGFLDLILPSKDASNRASYSLLLGNGTGAFTGGTPIATQASLGNNVAIVVADFDNDGDKDVVLGEVNLNVLVILTNDGLGNFTQSTILTGNGGGGIGTAVAAASGDFNKDGKPDFAILSALNKKAAIYLNTSTGGTISFLNTANPIATDIFPRSLVIGYFNADDNLDIAVANYSNNIVANTVSVAFGDGLGGFSVATPFAVGLNCREIAAGDLDNDGDIDLVTANYGAANISILTNNGSGNFTVSTKAVGINMNGLVINDFNGDGFNDILASSQSLVPPANTSSYTYLLLNNGTGGFLTPATLGTDFFNVGPQAGSLVAGDFNNDGSLDFISVNIGANSSTGSLSVLLNNCPPTATNLAVNQGVGGVVNGVVISTAFDGNQTANTLIPKVNGATTATVNGITISNLAVATNGNVTANISATCGATNSTFSISVTDNFNRIATATLTITIIPGPTITTQPTNKNGCDATPLNIPIVVAGLGLTYQWQVSTNGGGTFNNLTNIAPYTGVTSNTLNILTNATLNNNQYRCQITGACGSPTSNAITLTVQNLPISLTGTVPTGTVQLYPSTQINSTQAISATSQIEYQAGKLIDLMPGFTTNLPNVFKATIVGCQ
jgi:hypothetical protein